MNAKDIRKYVGQHLKFTFRNGVDIYAEIRAVYPAEGNVRLIHCGASDINGIKELPEEVAHPAEFFIVPSMIAKIKEVKRKSECTDGAHTGQEFDFTE